jgi:hypothetical protein
MAESQAAPGSPAPPAPPPSTPIARPPPVSLPSPAISDVPLTPTSETQYNLCASAKALEGHEASTADTPETGTPNDSVPGTPVSMPPVPQVRHLFSSTAAASAASLSYVETFLWMLPCPLLI